MNNNPVKHRINTNDKTGRRRICIDVPDETYDVVKKVSREMGLKPVTWGRMVFFSALRDHEEGKYTYDDRNKHTRTGAKIPRDPAPKVEFDPKQIKRILDELKAREERVKEREWALEEFIKQNVETQGITKNDGVLF